MGSQAARQCATRAHCTSSSRTAMSAELRRAQHEQCSCRTVRSPASGPSGSTCRAGREGILTGDAAIP